MKRSHRQGKVPSGPYRTRTAHRRVIPHAAKQHSGASRYPPGFPVRGGGQGRQTPVILSIDEEVA